MAKKQLTPDYIFESSWEVCNKVGGIYTVLSTRAKTLQEALQDKIIFIGPDFWKEQESPYFKEESNLFADWQWQAKEQGLKVRVGRWTIPGEPIAILVDFNPYFEKKNEIYGWLWENYGVDSLHAYGDYDEASMFSYAAALVVESFYNHYLNLKHKVIYHANEWMCGLGALYINNKLPQIGTIFTTHATSIGRSIAGNMKPLYDYLFAYNGDQMAGELNMQSKHSIESRLLTTWTALQPLAILLPRSAWSCWISLLTWYCQMVSTTALCPAQPSLHASVMLLAERCWMWLTLCLVRIWTMIHCWFQPQDVMSSAIRVLMCL